MKPLKLYTRTTLLTSTVLAMVLLLVVFFFITKISDLEEQDQEQRAKLLATQLANLLSYEAPREISKIRNRVYSFSEAHPKQIQEIRIYGVVRTGVLSEVYTLSMADPEEVRVSDIPPLQRGEPVARMREIEGDAGEEVVIYAIAPIFDGNVFQGAVSITTPRTRFSELSRRIIVLTLALLTMAIFSIVALFYFIFSQVLYKPIEDFLWLTDEVKNGNLQAFAPVRAKDEFGALAVSFNHMVSRLNEMTQEREAHRKDLEFRVQDATNELEIRNTQLEEANATLFEIQRELTKFERLAAAGQLAAQFAHEVGTPLNLISGHVQLLSARTTDQKTRDRLALVSSQIERIERIVRNMLDGTRRPRPALEPMDLNLLLRKIFEVTAPTLSARHVELRADLENGLPAVRGDGEQLQQVFINLINNSLDAMPRGGVLGFKTSMQNDQVEVTCYDNGPGIQKEILSRIFDPLFTTKNRERGSGFGLTVVQQIIREHGGVIEVESPAGEGARFVIQLPALPSGAETPTPVSALVSSIMTPITPGTSGASNILVIDDDLDTCHFLQEIFEDQGWRVRVAPNVAIALALVESEKFDLIISDINLNDTINGLQLLKRFRESAPARQVILISGFGTLETAIEAVQEGAFDFISKPFDVQEIIATARRALALITEHEEESPADKEILDRYASSGLVGHSRQMIDLYKEIARVAPHRSTVLIMGESGTGKELVARAIHANSPRRAGAFVAVNCGALTESLLEAELFGHTKGSFTGAIADKRGLFEEADHGTIFLDEISETSPSLQVKLLRVLQENEVRRVGGSKSQPVNVRAIAATNRDLEAEVKAGRFREDLYYRLSVITLQVPALRDRRDDIPLLAAHFLRRSSQETGKRVALSPEALELLLNHEWSGNVRELENSIEYAVLHSPGRIITPDDLPLRLRVAKEESPALPEKLFLDLPPLEEVERRYLLHVLDAVGGNRTRAAEVMQIDRRTLYRMAERFGIKLDGD